MKKSALNRRKDGTFGPWKGGITKGKYTSFHGTMVHIGQEFKKQKGRRARVGDLVRTKNKNGSYNKNAVWYLKTKFGWRRAGTGARKPTRADINKRLKTARPGRGK